MRFMSIIIIGLFFLFSCSETPNQAPVDSYRDVEVRVDMSNQINNNLFNPETDNLTLYLDSLPVWSKTQICLSFKLYASIPEGVIYIFLFFLTLRLPSAPKLKPISTSFFAVKIISL